MAADCALPTGSKRVWYDQSDGAGEIWCDHKILFLGLYVLNDTFTHVKGKRLIKGHTHSIVDALFGVLSIALQKAGFIHNLNDYCQFCRQTLGSK